MARLNTIAIGPGRGSAGDATYRKNRGRTIMSAKIKENPSNTALQEWQRKKFGGTSTVLANQPWFVANFSKSKYGSEMNHLMRVNRSMFATDGWGDFVGEPDADEMFLEFLTERTWTLGHDFYFAHGEAEYYNTTTRTHAGLGIVLQDIIISTNEALQPNASIAIRGKVKLGDKGESAVNAVFRLQQVDKTFWSMTSTEVAAILSADKVPFYIDGAGLAHVCIPFLGWSTTTFHGWSRQWRALDDIGIPGLHGTTTLPAAFWARYGTAPNQKIDWGVLMLHVNGKPVTYFKEGVPPNTAEPPAEDTATIQEAPAKTKKTSKKACTE